MSWKRSERAARVANLFEQERGGHIANMVISGPPPAGFTSAAVEAAFIEGRNVGHRERR